MLDEKPYPLQFPDGVVRAPEDTDTYVRENIEEVVLLLAAASFLYLEYIIGLFYGLTFLFAFWLFTSDALSDILLLNI